MTTFLVLTPSQRFVLLCPFLLTTVPAQAAAPAIATPEVAIAEPVTLQHLCDLVKQPATATSDKEFAAVMSTLQVGDIRLVVNPIFDSNSADFFWLHEFANWIHINSQPAALYRELSFQTGDRIQSEDLAEAQRLLRGKIIFTRCQNHRGRPV